jgi:hypothetical protein
MMTKERRERGTKLHEKVRTERPAGQPLAMFSQSHEHTDTSHKMLLQSILSNAYRSSSSTTI